MNHLRYACVGNPFSEVATSEQGDAVREGITTHEFELQLPVPTTQKVPLEHKIGFGPQSSDVVRARNLHTKRFQPLEEETLGETLVCAQRLHSGVLFVAMVLFEPF